MLARRPHRWFAIATLLLLALALIGLLRERPPVVVPSAPVAAVTAWDAPPPGMHGGAPTHWAS